MAYGRCRVQAAPALGQITAIEPDLCRWGMGPRRSSRCGVLGEGRSVCDLTGDRRCRYSTRSTGAAVANGGGLPPRHRSLWCFRPGTGRGSGTGSPASRFDGRLTRCHAGHVPELTEEDMELLKLARDGHEPTEQDRARIREMIAARTRAAAALIKAAGPPGTGATLDKPSKARKS